MKDQLLYLLCSKGPILNYIKIGVILISAEGKTHRKRTSLNCKCNQKSNLAMLIVPISQGWGLISFGFITCSSTTRN